MGSGCRGLLSKDHAAIAERSLPKTRNLDSPTPNLPAGSLPGHLQGSLNFPKPLKQGLELRAPDVRFRVLEYNFHRLELGTHKKNISKLAQRLRQP